MILYAHYQTIDLLSLTHDISTSGQFLGHKYEGRKQNKERFTLVACCNVDGSDKLPLLVIGK
jgi:hypothetical protein